MNRGEDTEQKLLGTEIKGRRGIPYPHDRNPPIAKESSLLRLQTLQLVLNLDTTVLLLG